MRHEFGIRVFPPGSMNLMMMILHDDNDEGCLQCSAQFQETVLQLERKAQFGFRHRSYRGQPQQPFTTVRFLAGFLTRHRVAACA